MKKGKDKKHARFEKDTIRGKQQKIELIYIAVSALLLLLSIIYTFTPLNIPAFNISLTPERQSELFINLFAVQATIAALSISIIAIITGFQTESVYGVTVTHYVTTLKPILFKHKVLMIIDLVITGINYVLVSFELYNISVMVFTISIIISCILILDTSFIFKSYSDIRNEIGQFVKENINIGYLKELENSLQESASIENNADIDEELYFLKSLFETELYKENYSKEVLEKVENILTNLFVNSYLSNNKSMVISILSAINRIYEITNESKKDYLLNIWSNTYIEYLTFIGTVSVAQLKDHNKFDFMLYKWNIEKNQAFEIKDGKVQEKNNFYLEYYSSWIYRYIILKNKDVFEKEDCQYLKKRIYQNTYWDALFGKTNYELKIKRIIGLCYLNKLLIENGELSLLKNEYLRNEESWLNEIERSYVYIVNIIYSIYLAYQEPMVKGKNEQIYAEKYLELIREHDISTLIYYLNIVDMLQKYFKSLYSMLGNWEKFEDGVLKTVTLEPAIIEFLFFVCVEKYYDEETLSKCFRIITSNHVETLIFKYFGENKKFLERYKIFYKRLFGKELSEQHLSSVEDIVKSALAREYKDELVESAEENFIRDEAVEQYKEKIAEFFEKKLNEYSIFNNEVDGIKTETISIDPGHLIDINDLNTKEIVYWITDYISHCLYHAFINSIKDNLVVKALNYKLKNKQETLIDLSKGINPDTIIACRETFWEEDDKNLLIRFTEGMNKICDKNNANNYYLINSSLIHFSVTNIQYSFKDCTVDDFNYLDIEIKDGKYYYSRIGTELKASFTKEEMFEYLKKTLKHLVITFDVNCAVKSDIVGCGIIVYYSESNAETDDDSETNDGEKQSSN